MASDLGERPSAAERLAERAELVLDPRLAEVWQVAWSLAGRLDPVEQDSFEPVFAEPTLAALLRLAYLQGYADATSEEVERSLYRELGVRDPGLSGQGPARAARRRRGSSDS